MEDFEMIDEHLQSIEDVFTFEDQSGVIHKLEKIWKNFLNFVNQLDLEDFVNFKHVAKILGDLSLEHELRPDRRLLPLLVGGQPNLIVSPEKEVHSICLSIYALGEAKLPKNDEVLMCTPETSLEQLELICR